MAKKKQKAENKNGDQAGLRRVSSRERWAAYRAFLMIMWRAHPGLAFVRLSLIAVSAVLQPVQVFVFSLLLEAIGRGQAERAPWLIGLTVGLYAAHRISNDISHSWIESWYSRAVNVRANDEIYSHLGQLSPEALNDPDVRRDLDFVREDLWRINNLPQLTEQVVRSCIQIAGALALGLIAPWWVLGLVLLISLLQAWNAQGESRRDIWNATWNSVDGRRIEYTRYVFLGVDDFRELRLLGAVGRLLKNFREASKRVLARYRRVGLKSAWSRGGLALLQGLAYAVIVIVLVPPAFQDPGLLSLVFISLNLFTLLGDALGQLASSSGNLLSDLSILARVRHLLEFPVEKKEGLLIPKSSITIEFKDVTFRYPGAKQDALSHISLTLLEGEHLAVVGENGAGKSTFLRLLAGLDRPNKGVILVNGRPLDEYHPDEWRRAFHLMLQDAKLYQDYLGENLRYGEASGKWKEAGFPLQKSLGIAGADAVVRELKSGLGTFIGDWAAPPNVEPGKVSGGQTQRLIIARSLIHGGRFIGFDEPTSAMDALAETAFFERLHDSLKQHGIIYISHRFSTVRRATRILVFEKGRMIEDGSHEDLLASEGSYSKLYREQAKWYS